MVVALVSRWWPAAVAVARVAAPVLALATVGLMTIPAGFDTTSAACLSALHVATIPAALLALRK